MDNAFQEVIFWSLAVLSVGAALLVVHVRNMFRAVLLLVVSFLGVAGLFAQMSAEFLAVKSAAGGLRDCIHTAGRQRAEVALERAAKFVMPEENAIVTALGELREPPEAAC